MKDKNILKKEKQPGIKVINAQLTIPKATFAFEPVTKYTISKR